MKAIIYLRVSTEDQSNSGLGMVAQERECRAVALRLGIDEIRVYKDEGVSGSVAIAERSGLKEALGCLGKNDFLIVAKRDRIARDMYIALTVEHLLKSRKATFISAAGEGSEMDVNDISALIQRRMLDLFAEVERQMIRSRTKAALHSKRLRGERIGSIPYGYTLSNDGIHLLPCVHEQEVISLVKKLHKKGISTRKLAQSLNKKNVASRTGNPWSRTQITRIISITEQ